MDAYLDFALGVPHLYQFLIVDRREEARRSSCRGTIITANGMGMSTDLTVLPEGAFAASTKALLNW